MRCFTFLFNIHYYYYLVRFINFLRSFNDLFMLVMQFQFHINFIFIVAKPFYKKNKINVRFLFVLRTL